MIGRPARIRPPAAAAAMLAVLLLLVSCTSHPQEPRPGQPVARRGDEIMVAGQLFHTGAPVVLWTDPGGYDAYRTEKRFVPWERAAWTPPERASRGGGGAGGAGGTGGPSTPNRYGLRFANDAERLPPEVREQVRGGGWDLSTLQALVDQFVIHYDVCGTSRQCFKVLHDLRGLSVHFMLDIDGTIYQTLDLKERAWHGGAANDRSIGIEIANIGAYAPAPPAPPATPAPGAAELLPPPLNAWYVPDSTGWPVITLPAWMGDGGVRTTGFVGRPIRPDPVVGEIHGQTLVQFDLTPEQYDSLIKLTAALCEIFPNLPCDYPRDEEGRLITTVLSDERLAAHRGLIGHFHLTAGKIDPGPAFQWDRIIDGVREIREGSGSTRRARKGR